MLSPDNRLNWQCNPFERHQLWRRWIWNCHLFYPFRHVWWKNEQDARTIQWWPGSVEEKHPRRLAKGKTTSLTSCHTSTVVMNLQSLMAISFFFVVERAWEPEIWNRDRRPLWPSRSCIMPAKNKELKEWIQTCETCMEFEHTQCKESLISHDYSRKSLAEDRGWYFQLHLYPPTNCTSRNYTKSSAQSLQSWRFTSQGMELIRNWLQAMAYNSSLLTSNSNTAQSLPITVKTPMVKLSRQ